MKKVLALVLCALMLIGGMGIVSFAEETAARIAVTNGSTLDGWSINAKPGDGIPALHINTEIDPDGYGAVAMTLTGEIYADGGWKNPEGNGKTPTKGMKIVYKPADDKSKGVESYDVSGMNYFAFDLYLSDASVLAGKTMYLELTSSGTVDQQEICWGMSFEEMNGGKALVDGWNHVEIALNSYNQTPPSQEAVFDNTQWNFMRLHNGDEFDAGESFTIALKNLYFSVLSSDGKLPGEQPTTPGAPVDPVTPPTDDWAPIPVEGGFVFPNDKWLDSSRSEGLPQGVWAEHLAEADGVKPWSVTYTGLIAKEGGWNRPEGATGWKVCFTLPNTADISGMKSMVLDFYISDASAIENALFYLELSSRPSGNVDMEENNIKASLSQIAGKPIVDGWNHLEISLDAMTQGTGNDKPIAMDATRFKTMRIYSTQNDIDLGDKELVVAYKNFGFIESSKAADVAKEAAESVIALFEQIADIGTGDITADNYETVKAQLAAALEAYEAADVGTQAAVEEAGINANKIKRTIERALDKYEEELNQPTDEPEQPTTPADPEKPDTPSNPDTPEKPDTPADPTEPEQPADKGGLNPVVIAVIAVAVVAVVVIVIIVIKKKK